MAKEAENSGGGRRIPWRLVGWGIAALLLLLPLVAMRFTTEVNWDGEDFIFAGVLIGTVGLIYELTVRKTRNWTYRAGVAAALAATFLIVWANGAVGMIGSERNPYNFLFGGVILIALVGAIAGRFRPAAMALAMIAAAIAHAAVALGGLFTDVLGGVLSAAFAGLWLLSAALFRKAARDRKPARAAP
jgi:hypothetical protein